MTHRPDHPANDPAERRAAPLPPDLGDVAAIDTLLGDLLAGELVAGPLKAPAGLRERVFEASVGHLPAPAPLVFTTTASRTWRSRFAGAGRLALAASVGLAALVAISPGPSGSSSAVAADTSEAWASDHVIEFLLNEQSRSGAIDPELLDLDENDAPLQSGDVMGYLSRSGEVGLDSVVNELDQIWGELEG